MENRTHYLHLFRFCYCKCCVDASIPFRITAYFRRTDREREKKISCCCSTKSTNNWTKKIWNSLEEQNFAFSAILVAVTFSFPAWIDELTTEPTYSKCISYSNNNCYYRYCLKILLATVFLAFLSAHQWIRMFFFLSCMLLLANGTLLPFYHSRCFGILPIASFSEWSSTVYFRDGKLCRAHFTWGWHRASKRDRAGQWQTETQSGYRACMYNVCVCVCETTTTPNFLAKKKTHTKYGEWIFFFFSLAYTKI